MPITTAGARLQLQERLASSSLRRVGELKGISRSARDRDSGTGPGVENKMFWKDSTR